MQLMASAAQFWFALLFQNLMLLFSMSLGTQNGTDPSEAAAYSTIFKRKPSLPYIYFFPWFGFKHPGEAWHWDFASHLQLSHPSQWSLV